MPQVGDALTGPAGARAAPAAAAVAPPPRAGGAGGGGGGAGGASRERRREIGAQPRKCKWVASLAVCKFCQLPVSSLICMGLGGPTFRQHAAPEARRS
eukprot:COSAG03_NODE_7258_length_942_cov_1.087782_2_plen_97_part_01